MRLKRNAFTVGNPLSQLKLADFHIMDFLYKLIICNLFFAVVCKSLIFYAFV